MPISLSDIKIQFQNTLHIMGKMLNNHALLPESLVHFVLLLYTGRMKCARSWVDLILVVPLSAHFLAELAELSIRQLGGAPKSNSTQPGLGADGTF